VTTLRSEQARRFLVRVADLDERATQLVLAKITGHFKHGNER